VTDWHLSGTYLEACNCEAICPCRRVGGVGGGRSTYGECYGALSWWIEDGADAGVDLSGLGVVIACRYHDDEPGSPWRYVLYLDERADAPQRAALEAIYTGRRGGSALLHFPWAWKAGDLLAVRPAKLEIEHRARRGWFRAADEIVVRVDHDVEQPEAVSCVIPGHHQPGTEVVTELMDLGSEAAIAELRGRCGFRSRFAYSADEAPLQAAAPQ
jgi:hypothetical protein